MIMANRILRRGRTFQGIYKKGHAQRHQVRSFERITDPMAAFAVLEEINGRARLFEAARQFAGDSASEDSPPHPPPYGAPYSSFGSFTDTVHLAYCRCRAK
jgi:hypothetical protein